MKYRSTALLSAFFLLFCLKPYAGKEGEGAVTRKATVPADQAEKRSKGRVKAPVKAGEIPRSRRAPCGAGSRSDQASPRPDLSRSGRGKTPIIRSTLRAKG